MFSLEQEGVSWPCGLLLPGVAWDRGGRGPGGTQRLLGAVVSRQRMVPQMQSGNSPRVLFLDVSLPVRPTWILGPAQRDGVCGMGRLRFWVDSLPLALVLSFKWELGPFCNGKNEPETLL